MLRHVVSCHEGNRFMKTLRRPRASSSLPFSGAEHRAIVAISAGRSRRATPAVLISQDNGGVGENATPFFLERMSMTNPWKSRAKGGTLPQSGDLAPGMPVRKRQGPHPVARSSPWSVTSAGKQDELASERPRVRHSDLAPICTLRQRDLEPPSEIGIDSRDGPFLVLEFDPGLPMTVIHEGLRFVYHHHRDERAYYHVDS